MMYLTNDVNFQYFFHDGTPYRTGTIVKFKKSYTETHMYDGKHIWQYAFFSHRVAPYGYSKYLFSMCKYPPYSDVVYAGYFSIKEEDIEDAIEEIVKPVHIELVKKEKKKDAESPEVILGWVILTIVLFFSFILTEWYLVWFWGLIVFFVWRNKKLWE